MGNVIILWGVLLITYIVFLLTISKQINKLEDETEAGPLYIALALLASPILIALLPIIAIMAIFKKR